MSVSVSGIQLTIDGNRSDDFLIQIDGTLLQADDFMLNQSLMQPNILTFRLRKGPREDDKEPQFSTCSAIIGKDISLSLLTDHMESLSSIVKAEKKTGELRFKGIIVSASGNRTHSEYCIDVEARSYDAMLIDNPSCKSYEDMTLNEIVEDVVDEYAELISARIDARFTDVLPYTVQYNEPDYNFLLRLAQRFGEWIYNDGEHLVFGKIPKGETVVLGYPDTDIPAYNVDMRMQHTAFSHLASSYNAYDATQKEGVEEMEREYNNLADVVFNIARERFSKSTLQHLHSGGFADSDGRDTVLNVSTKTQARGQKAGMLTYSGMTYCSKLRIGSILIIKDNYLHDDLPGSTSDVEQSEILITEIIHSFSANGPYSNRFAGIPSACDYPPYSNSDVYPVAPSCRAKVTDNEDPNNLGRVRVQFDWQAQLDGSMMTPWLRISQPYAGGGKGFSFIPEIGEEVMIDFEGGNAERPYVKGTLYNGVGNPDGAWVPESNGRNPIKAIRTRNGHTIEIHDEGSDGYIRIYDNGKNNYILTFSTDKKLIRLQSTGNIELEAANDIIMHAGHDIKASADHDIILYAKHDMLRTADNDIEENAGHDSRESVRNDRKSSIGRDDQLTVAANQILVVRDNKSDEIAHQLQISAENIRMEAEDKLVEYSTTQEQKANDTISVNADNLINIKANIVKIN